MEKGAIGYSQMSVRREGTVPLTVIRKLSIPCHTDDCEKRMITKSFKIVASLKYIIKMQNENANTPKIQDSDVLIKLLLLSLLLRSYSRLNAPNIPDSVKIHIRFSPKD